MTAGINNGLNGTIADSLTYGNEYPIANIDQSSQQFRDNFKILQASVENIQGKTVALTGEVTGSALIDSGSANVVISATVVGYLPTTGGTMTGNLILNSDPTQALQAATKQYVDALAGGITVLDNASTAISGVTQIQFNDNLTTIDYGDGSVRINAANTDTLLTVLDNASTAITDVTQVQFGDNLVTIDNGDGTVRVNGPASSTISVRDDSSALITPVDTFRFGNYLRVEDDENGDVTVHGTGGNGSGFISVIDYGAVGDGVTDDTAAFQAALDDATSWDQTSQVREARTTTTEFMTSRVVYVPKGRYVLSDLTLANGDHMFGEGPTQTRLEFTSTSTTNLFVTGQSGNSSMTTNYPVVIENMTLSHQRPTFLNNATDMYSDIGPYMKIQTHEYTTSAEYETGIITATNRIRGFEFEESEVPDEVEVIYEDMGTGLDIGLVDGTTYWLHRQGGSGFKVYPTLADAQGDTNEMNLTSVGLYNDGNSGIQHFRYTNSLEYTTDFISIRSACTMHNVTIEARGGANIIDIYDTHSANNQNDHKRRLLTFKDIQITGSGTEAIIHCRAEGHNAFFENVNMEPWNAFGQGIRGLDEDYFRQVGLGTLQPKCGMEIEDSWSVHCKNVNVYGIYGKSWREGEISDADSGHGFFVHDECQDIIFENCTASWIGGSAFVIDTEDDTDDVSGSGFNAAAGGPSYMINCSATETNLNSDYATLNDLDFPVFDFRSAVNWHVKDCPFHYVGPVAVIPYTYWVRIGRARHSSFHFRTPSSYKWNGFWVGALKSLHHYLYFDEGTLQHSVNFMIDNIRFHTGVNGSSRQDRLGSTNNWGYIGGNVYTGTSIPNFNPRNLDGPTMLHQKINEWMLQDVHNLHYYEFNGSSSTYVDSTVSSTNERHYTVRLTGLSGNLDRMLAHDWQDQSDWNDPVPNTNAQFSHEFSREGDMVVYDANGGTDIGSLVSGNEYFALLPSENSTAGQKYLPSVNRIGFANSFSDAAVTRDTYTGGSGDQSPRVTLATATGTEHRVYHRNYDVTGLMPMYEYEIVFENIVLSEDTDVWLQVSEDRRQNWASTDEYDWGFDRTFITSNDHQGQNSDSKIVIAQSVESTSKMDGRIRFSNPGDKLNIAKFFDFDVKHVCASSPFAGEITRVKGVGSYTSSTSNKGEEITSVRIHPASGYIVSGSVAVYKRYGSFGKDLYEF